MKREMLSRSEYKDNVFKACARGSINKFKDAINERYGLFIKNNLGEHPLEIALKNRTECLSCYMLNNSYLSDQINLTERDYLSIAIKRKFHMCAQKIFHSLYFSDKIPFYKGVVSDLPNKKLYDVCSLMIEKGQTRKYTTLVQQIISEKTSICLFKNEMGDTLVHKIVRCLNKKKKHHRLYDLLRFINSYFLNEKKHPINITNNNGLTPFLLALSLNKFTMAHDILRNFKDIKIDYLPKDKLIPNFSDKMKKIMESEELQNKYCEKNAIYKIKETQRVLTNKMSNLLMKTLEKTKIPTDIRKIIISYII